MTGTTMEMEPFGAAWPSLANKAIAEAVQKNIDTVGVPKWSDDEVRFAKELQKSMGIKEQGLATQPAPLAPGPRTRRSNDIGDITWVVPTGWVRFPSAVLGVQAHHWTAGITPTMSIAHKGAVVGAKVIAASVLDLMTSPELRTAANKQFEEDTKEMESFFPIAARRKAASRPQQGNDGEISRAMRKFYLSKKPQFR